MSGDQLEIMTLCGLEKPWPSFFLVVPVFTSLTSSLSFEVGFVLEALFNAEGPLWTLGGLVALLPPFRWREWPPDPSPNDTATVVCAAAEEIASLIHSEVICW